MDNRIKILRAARACTHTWFKVARIGLFLKLFRLWTTNNDYSQSVKILFFWDILIYLNKGFIFHDIQLYTNIFINKTDIFRANKGDCSDF